MTGWLDGTVLNVLQKGLEASSLRQQVLSDNVANVDTPSFKRSDVDFQAVLSKALGKDGGTLPMKVTLPQHLSGVLGESNNGIVTDNSTSLRNDGNNVDIDKEMSNVAENGLYYESMTQAISSQLGLLRMAISGGKG